MFWAIMVLPRPWAARHRKNTCRQSARSQTTNRNESTRPRGPDVGVDNHRQIWEDRDALNHAPPRDLARGPGVVKTPGPHPPAPSAGLALPQVNSDRNLRNIRIPRYPSRIPLFLEITNSLRFAHAPAEKWFDGAPTPPRCSRMSGRDIS